MDLWDTLQTTSFSEWNKCVFPKCSRAASLPGSNNTTIAASRYQHQPVHPPLTVPHELKFSIWWNEADAPLRIKLAEPHTLVESAVINCN